MDIKNVAIMYSGGKDSTYAIAYAKKRGWNISYLLSVKPTRKDCFLFHFATVEHTSIQADIFGLPHHLISCDVADPDREAKLVEDFVQEHPVDAVILGGTGLQETQLKSIQEALLPHKVEVFAAHAGHDHEQLIADMIQDGYSIMLTQVASDGLGKWLGTVLDKENFTRLRADAKKYGFHIGFEGGYADTYVLDGPIFRKKIIVKEFSKQMDDAYCGHVTFEEVHVRDKPLQELDSSL